MSQRIDSIYYFDYTKTIGHYDSIRDFSSEKMTYIGSTLSTPRIHVNSVPYSFNISAEGSSQIREYAVSQMNKLQEISKDLAVNSPKYILICYFDGTKRYYRYNESFSVLFKEVFHYKPHKEPEDTYESPIALQSSTYSTIERNNSQPSENSISYAYTGRYSQKNTTYRPVNKKKTFHWGMFGILIVLLLILAPALALFDDPDANIDSHLNPLKEPQSGTLLSGSVVHDGSEITITASGGASCVVKLKSSSDVERLSFYVRAGETATVGVPAEYLYVYFASGDTWYGVADLFGEKTSYSMDDDLLDFTEYSWEYTLYPVTNGNFSQTPIDASDFN